MTCLTVALVCVLGRVWHAQMLVSRMDTDKDGTVSIQEFARRLQAVATRPAGAVGVGSSRNFPLAVLADPALARRVLETLVRQDVSGAGVLPPQLVHTVLMQAGLPLSFQQFTVRR